MSKFTECKSDLEKMDANVAQMYATKCQKSQEELLALMKKGGRLTAQEALEWGFVDEITDYEEDAAPVITDSIGAIITIIVKNNLIAKTLPEHRLNDVRAARLMMRINA